MAGARIANAATRATRSSLSHAGREGTTEQPPAVVEWNAKRRRLVLRVFNTKTVDRRRQPEVARGPYSATTEPPSSPDHDPKVSAAAAAAASHSRYRPRIDIRYGNSESAFQSGDLSVEESNYNKQFEPERTAASAGGSEGRDIGLRHGDEKPAFSGEVGDAITNTGGRLEHKSKQDAADKGAQHRVQVIEPPRPNLQTTEPDAVDYFAESNRSLPRRLLRIRHSGGTHESSAVLLNPGTVSIKLYPTNLNRIRKIKGPADRLSDDERLHRKQRVRESSFLEGTIILDPLGHNTGITVDPLHRRTKVLEHRAVGRQRTMNKFPSKRPSTPENLKGLSAKHYLRTLRDKDAETDPRRHQRTSEGSRRRRDWSPSETDLIEEEDYVDTRTVSTGSNSTVYLLRTVKKPNRYGSNSAIHKKTAEPAGSKSNERVEPHPRKATLKPVTQEGSPDDKDADQRTGPKKKTRRVKNSVTQTNDDTIHDNPPLVAESAPLPRFITPRRPKRSIGLQTVIEEDLRKEASSISDPTSSRRIRPKKATIAIQTDIPKTAKGHTKTTVATQTMERETASKVTTSSGSTTTRGQKEKQDFNGQTENSLTKTTVAEQQTSERERTILIPSLRHDQQVPDVNWTSPTTQPRPLHHDAMTNGFEENPPKTKPEVQGAATNVITHEDQEQLVNGLHHEVRLLRHENYYLRQQLDYPIKPKGRLQKQNEEKILQVIRHLESQGPTGKLTSQIREEMMHEAMIENEILRSENSDLQTTLDRSRRLQETLSTENEQLRHEIELHQRKMALHDGDNGHRQVAPDGDSDPRRQLPERDDIDATRPLAPTAFTIYMGEAESAAMTTAAPRTRAAIRQTRIPKLSSEGELKKSEIRN